MGTCKTRKKLPKAFLGAAVGMAYSIGSGIAANQKAKNNQRIAEREGYANAVSQSMDTMQLNQQNTEMTNNANAIAQQSENSKKLAGFDTSGVLRDFNMFKKGGPINGGELNTNHIAQQGGEIPVSSTGSEFVGPSHERGGIEVADNLGRPLVEVEGGEGEHTINGNPFISSDYLKNPTTGNTFAKDMLKVEKQKGKIEKAKKLRPMDTRLDNAMTRTNSKLNSLARFQESLKGNNGVI